MIIKNLSIPEMIHTILYIEGSGIYRLLQLKSTQTSITYVILKVKEKKVELIKKIVAEFAAKDSVMKCWNELETTYSNLSVYHLENGDIRVVKNYK